MTLDTAAAAPYARALHALAKERGETDAIGRELEAAAAAFVSDPDLAAFFQRPWIPTATKRTVALELATRLGVSSLTRDFLGLVARQGRAGHLTAISTLFRQLVDEDLGRARASVRTAVPLSDADRQQLRQSLGRALGGKQVVLDEKVDHQLLGGFVAEVGSYLVDGSLDGQLQHISERLARG